NESLLMRDARACRLVDETPGDEAVEVEWPADLVMLSRRQQMRRQPATRRDRLETAGAPAAIEIKPRQRRWADDRRGIRYHVDDTRPLAQHLQLAERRE